MTFAQRFKQKARELMPEQPGFDDIDPSLDVPQKVLEQLAQTSDYLLGMGAAICSLLDQEQASAVAPAALPAQGASDGLAQAQAVDVLLFEMRHPNGERRTVAVSHRDVRKHSEDLLYDALAESYCRCEPVGETNVVDCNCHDYLDEFELVGDGSSSLEAIQSELPMQPIAFDDAGVIRFRPNGIVQHLLDFSTERGCGPTELAMMQFSEEERMQLAQLIGYSVSGYGELSYANKASVERADRIAASLAAAGQP